MTRIADLQKKYPTIPLEVIVKWEILNTGVGDSDDLDKVSQWLRRNNVGTYQTYDHDVTLKDQAVKRPERIKDGHMLRPNTMYMANGIGAKIRMDSRSPYRIKDRGDGRMAIFEGEDMVDMDVYFPPKPPLEEAMTSKGTPVTDLVNLNQRCFFIVPVRYCEYFATGDQCKFCNFNGTQEDAKSIGINRSVTISLDETVEAYKILGSDVKYPEGKLEMGGFMNSETEAKIYMDFVGALANALPYKPSYNLVTQAMSRKNMQRLKDVGLEAIALQMEAFDPAYFAQVVPGKSKHCTREQWLEAYVDAVDVYGAGNVSGKIIGGLTMIPEDGHKTWQEARDSHIEGNNWLISNGVFPTFTNLRLPPGSVYGENPANRDKLPPTEYYLEVAMAHHKTMKEYNLYEKLNRFIYCGLCCTAAPYSAEMGILELEGDVGNWMSKVVPDEDNWMAQFIASVKSEAKVQ